MATGRSNGSGGFKLFGAWVHDLNSGAGLETVKSSRLFFVSLWPPGSCQECSKDPWCRG